VSATLEESARWVGGHRWLEARLFEVVGGWVTTTADTEVKLMLDRHSRHHAWRAAQWTDRLPVLADVDRDQLTAAPSAQAAVLIDSLRAVEGGAARLAGVYRVVLPRLWSRYERHRRSAGEAADSSVLRTLAMLTTDVAADWHEGEACLQGELVDEDAVRSAAAAVVSLEGLLAVGGGRL
jgi:hypothetical protein